MYRIIAYHGKGDGGEVESDLRLLWDGLRDFVKARRIRHIYCFQAINEGKEADLLLIVQYRDDVARKLTLSKKIRQASQIHNHVDYWFYVRDRGPRI